MEVTQMSRDSNVPAPPTDLGEPYQELWNSYAHRMKYPGKLVTFAQCLYALQRADQARKAIDEQGLTTTSKRGGMHHLNPLLRVELQNRQMFVKLWAQLGLNNAPSAFDDLATV
jgi:phage terminase small subunit